MISFLGSFGWISVSVLPEWRDLGERRGWNSGGVFLRRRSDGRLGRGWLGLKEVG